MYLESCAQKDFLYFLLNFYGFCVFTPRCLQRHAVYFNPPSAAGNIKHITSYVPVELKLKNTNSIYFEIRFTITHIFHSLRREHATKFLDRHKFSQEYLLHLFFPLSTLVSARFREKKNSVSYSALYGICTERACQFWNRIWTASPNPLHKQKYGSSEAILNQKLHL